MAIPTATPARSRDRGSRSSRRRRSGASTTATLDVIEHVGVRFPSQRALDVWADARRDGRPRHAIVRVPGHVIEACAARRPATYALGARDPARDLPLDGHHVYAGHRWLRHRDPRPVDRRARGARPSRTLPTSPASPTRWTRSGSSGSPSRHRTSRPRRARWRSSPPCGAARPSTSRPRPSSRRARPLAASRWRGHRRGEADAPRQRPAALAHAVHDQPAGPRRWRARRGAGRGRGRASRPAS